MHSQHYSQIKLTMQTKNEMIRKHFVECKQKLFLNRNQSKTYNQSKTQKKTRTTYQTSTREQSLEIIPLQ
jgi:hypothetical protein